MEMKCRWFILMLLCAFSLSLFAASHDDETIKAKINAIKTDEAFLGAEATREDEAEAYHEAVADVHFYFNQMMISQQRDTVSLQQIHSCLRSLSHSRGDMVRVFAYVRIEDVLKSPVPKSESESVVSGDAMDPVPTHPVDSVPARPQAQDPPASKSQAQTITSASDLAVQTTSGILDVIMTLRQVQMMGDALSVLRKFQSEGKVQAYEQVHSLNDVVAGRYLIVCDQQKQIKALLEVQTDAVRNIVTKQQDSLSNYRGCLAFWFK